MVENVFRILEHVIDVGDIGVSLVMEDWVECIAVVLIKYVE
jgi:hypothetical protein